MIRFSLTSFQRSRLPNRRPTVKKIAGKVSTRLWLICIQVQGFLKRIF